VTVPYTPPEFGKGAFNCPFCNAYSRMNWLQTYVRGSRGGFDLTLTYVVICTHCNERSYWLADPYEGDAPIAGRMLSPQATPAPMPHQDMPADVRTDYEEARLIAANSPRGAAALLRLGIQKLCVHLGESGKNINDDIAAPVRKGLPVEIQQALDIVRVVGNNAVHPGELNASDVAAVSSALFDLVNQIIEERISRPKKLQAMFAKLPQGAQQAIKKRDGP